jgi:hypothetical protein
MNFIPKQQLACALSASLSHVPSAATNGRNRALADVLRKIAYRFNRIISNELQDVV